MILIYYSCFYLNENALWLSFGYPAIFSAKTRSAASVGSPTLLKSLNYTSTLELLFTVHPTAIDLNKFYALL